MTPRTFFVVLSFVPLAVIPGAPAPLFTVPRPAAPPQDGHLAGPPAPAPVTPMSTVEAIEVALDDLERLAHEDRPFIRYLWCPDKQFKPVVLALNIISRAVRPVRPWPLAGGRLLRVDLRLYGRYFDYPGSSKDLDEWLEFWEDLQYDPSFSLLVTRASVNFAAQVDPNVKKQFKAPVKRIRKVVDCPVYRGDDGKFYNWKYVYEYVEQDFFVLRFNPAHLPRLARLQEAAYSQAPIVHDLYFAARVLSTVKNKRAYAVVWGGRYYEFRGINKSKKKGVTDEDLFLRLFGIDNARKLFDQLQSDQRAGLFKSAVTDKPRRIDFFNTPAGRSWDVIGLGSITHDLADEDVDVDVHPVMNLLDFKDSAREEIFVGANGFHVYAIFDGKGNLLDEADIHVVTDRTVPGVATPVLQPALSCLACHEAEGSGGWKDAPNDVKKLLQNRTDPETGRGIPDLDVFLDVSRD